MISYIKSELSKQFHSKSAFLMIALTVFAPGLGYIANLQTMGDNYATRYLLSPVKMGAFILALAVAAIIIFDLNKLQRFGMLRILDAAVDTRQLYLAMITARLIVVALGVMLSCIVHRVVGLIIWKNNFAFSNYLFFYFVLLYGAVVLATLIAAALYLAIRRVDASILLMIILVAISFYSRSNYLLAWVQSNIPALSEGFGNAIAIRVCLWNRLFCMLLASGVFMLSLLFSRKKEPGFYQPIRDVKQHKHVAVIGAVLVCSSIFCYLFEPYFDDSAPVQFKITNDKESGMSAAEMVMKIDKNDKVVRQEANADISVNTRNATIQGTVKYRLDNLSEQNQQVNIKIQPGYRINDLLINGEAAETVDQNITAQNQRTMTFTLPKGKGIIVEIAYGGSPKLDQWSQDTLGGGNPMISRDLVSLGGAGLMPQLEIDQRDSEVKGTITLPSHLTPVTSGAVNQKLSENNGESVWSFSSRSSLFLTAANYQVETIQAGGIDVQFYHAKQNSDLLFKHDVHKTIEAAIDYFTKKIGRLGYYNEPLKIVEGSALMFGGFAVGNICMVGETALEAVIYDRQYEGQRGISVLVHEICHQWWGVSVQFTQGGVWSPEGMTVYYTYKFMRDYFGQAVADKEGPNEWQNGYRNLKSSFYYNNPQYLDIIPEIFVTSILSENNSVMLYNLMPLQIKKAEDIVGSEKFEKKMATLYKRNKNMLRFEDFLNACDLTKGEVAID